MDFVFILGKNAELSCAEIEAYLKARSVSHSVEDKGEDFLVVRAEKMPENIIEGLGGTLKVGEVIFSGEGVEGADFDKMFSKLPEKALFAVSCYGQPVGNLAEILKKKMKENGIKAGYLHSDTPITHTDIVRKKLLEKGAEFLACKWKKFWLARTVAVHNPYEFQKRDMDRPVQRAIFSIPPRLSRIMVNLTGCTKGVLLDPFCGIGSILQEAALLGLDVRGEDIDESAVKGCRENLAWLEKAYGMNIGSLTEKIRQGDARKLSQYFEAGSVNAIATEPYLGEPLKERPDLKEAMKILEQLEPLYVESLKEMEKIIRAKGRIVIISPFFEAGDKNAALDIGAIASRSGLRLIARYPDFEERHKTLRMINVLQKD